ncbi:MAG TPA: type II toxin-antitoxin system VapC family toxin [Stellaceae bacterium]|jgi:predicted nucleic acid-binding protein|nr:type II toxin-antitoxin system VapC family toxin [Stellaceae bacterium]
MAVKVVDASALAAVIFDEPEADLVDGRLGGADLVAPGLLAFEMANICLTKLRRNSEQRERILSQFADQIMSSVEARAVDHAEVIELAEQFRLSAYDASYLWLARELGAELVTLDRQLARAAAALPQT